MRCGLEPSKNNRKASEVAAGGHVGMHARACREQSHHRGFEDLGFDSVGVT